MNAKLMTRFYREYAGAVRSDRDMAAFLASWGSTDPSLAHPPTDAPAAEPAPPPPASVADRDAPERVERSRDRLRPDVPDVILTRAAEVRPEAIAWAWTGRVPLGSLTLLVGQPGLGKSTLAVTLAALATRGNLAGDLGEPVTVLYLSAEDSVSYTLVPRLMAAGADLGRVQFLTLRDDAGERGLALPDDIASLADAVRRSGARLVCVDPIMAHLATALDVHRDHSIRRALAPLAHLADDATIAILAVAHLNKSAGADLFARVGGSIGLTAAARSVLVMGTDPQAGEDAPDRIIAHGKSNVGPLAPALRVRIEGRTVDMPDGPIPTSGIAWTGEAPGVHVSDLLTSPEEGEQTALADAERFLLDALAAGPVPAKQVQAEAKEALLAWRTVRRAQERLGIQPRKVGRPGEPQAWVWALPDAEGGQESPKMSTPGNMDIFGNDGHLRDAEAPHGVYRVEDDYPPSATDPEDDQAHHCPICGHAMVVTPTGRYVCTNAPGHAKASLRAPEDDPEAAAWLAAPPPDEP
jgi:putative DNA primase/helicase